MIDIKDKVDSKEIRIKFWESVEISYKKLKANKTLYQEEIEERKLWENTLMDGLENEL